MLFNLLISKGIDQADYLNQWMALVDYKTCSLLKCLGKETVSVGYYSQAWQNFVTLEILKLKPGRDLFLCTYKEKGLLVFTIRVFCDVQICTLRIVFILL